MINIKNYSGPFFCALLIAFLLFACNEEDLVQLDPTRLTPENYFATEAQLEAAVLSPYAPIRAAATYGRWYSQLTDYADDHHEPTSDAFWSNDIHNGVLSSTTPFLDVMWDGFFLIIHRANTALAGIEQNTTVDEQTRNALAGEARFLRGLAYSDLATIWGGVPLHTTPITTFADLRARSSREEVFAQAISDLQFAADNLPLERSDEFKGRATRGAALGMLGRTYMQIQDLDGARRALEAVLDLGIYSLNEDWFSTFSEENDFTPESLFEVVYGDVAGFNFFSTGDVSPAGPRTRTLRTQYYGPSWRNSYPSGELVNLFERVEDGDPVTDPRLRLTAIFEGDAYNNGMDTLVASDIKLNGINGKTTVDFHGQQVLVNWYKYQTYYKERPFGFNHGTTNTVLMRLADVYLLLAEIEAREGNLDAARSYVDLVRNRVGLPKLENSRIPNGSQEEVIAAVIRERSVELAGEQVRWRDIRRWDEAGIIDAEDIFDYWTQTNFLWPLPNTEIDNNPNISVADQNPGY